MTNDTKEALFMKTKYPDLTSLFRQGKLFSYIESLEHQLEDLINNQNGSQLEALLNSIYENSELLDFFEHYSAFIPRMDLYRRVLIIKRKLLSRSGIPADINAAAKTVLDAVDHYLSPSSPDSFENEELKYMVLPAVSQPGPNDEPAVALDYIFYEPVAVPDDQWLADQFYSFNDQTRAIKYFETLVDEIKVNLLLQQRSGVGSRVDIPEMRWPHYGIFFDQKVVGRAFGGELLILLILAYVETVCGAKGHGFGGYVPGTMVQAIVRQDGTVIPPGHLLLKTNAFLDEFGTHHVRLIFAEGSQEKLNLQFQQGKYIIGDHSIDGDKIIFVKNTGELCAAAFPRWKHLLETVWRKLPDSYRQELYSGLAREWTPGKIQQEFFTTPLTRPTLLTYTPVEKGLKTSFYYCGETRGLFDVRFGFEENAFFVGPGEGVVNEIVVIAIDGSWFAEPLWLPDKGDKDSQIARAVFEISRNLPGKNRSFYVHFLSSPEPELLNIRRFNDPSQLDRFLHKRRSQLQLHLRGNFIAPVLHYWASRSMAAHKRLMVITNGPVYDCKDFTLDKTFRENRWFCFKTDNKKYLPRENITLLNNISKDINEKLKIPPRKIQKVKITFEDWFPYEWNPVGMALKSHKKDHRTRVFEYEPGNGSGAVILKGRILSNVPAKSMDYEIEIKDETGLHTTSGHLPGKDISFLQYHSDVISGQLLEDEQEMWENFFDESKEYICPVCDKQHERTLKCKPEGEMMPQVIFPSLRRFTGYVILQPHENQWLIAKTGVNIEENYFFKMNGMFYVFCPARSSRPQQVKQGNITIGGKTFYIEEL
jgi:hypothetical protein